MFALLAAGRLLADDRAGEAGAGPAGGDPASTVEAFDVVELAASAESDDAGPDEDGGDGDEEDNYEHEWGPLGAFDDISTEPTTQQLGPDVKPGNAVSADVHLP